jgi:epoxide hydrolase-like predicted phosphatase
VLRAVVFDFGGTLFYEEPAEHIMRDLQRILRRDEIPYYQDVYKFLGLRFDNVCEASLEAVAYYYASLEGRGRVNLRRARELEEVLSRVLSEHLKPIDGTKEVIKELKERGYKIAIISNASSQRAVEHAIEREGLADLVDAVVTSRLVGVRKPDPRIFLYTLGLIEIRPSEAVFVGDREYEDVCGAKGVGMKAVHLVPKGIKPSPCADAHITSIVEVLKALERL